MASPHAFPNSDGHPKNPLRLGGKTVLALRALWKAIQYYKKEPTQETDQKLDTAMRRALVCFNPKLTLPEEKNGNVGL